MKVTTTVAGSSSTNEKKVYKHDLLTFQRVESKDKYGVLVFINKFNKETKMTWFPFKETIEEYKTRTGKSDADYINRIKISFYSFQSFYRACYLQAFKEDIKEKKYTKTEVEESAKNKFWEFFNEAWNNTTVYKDEAFNENDSASVIEFQLKVLESLLNELVGSTCPVLMHFEKSEKDGIVSYYKNIVPYFKNKSTENGYSTTNMPFGYDCFASNVFLYEKPVEDVSTTGGVTPTVEAESVSKTVTVAPVPVVDEYDNDLPF